MRTYEYAQIFAIIVHFKVQTGPQRDSSREKDT